MTEDIFEEAVTRTASQVERPVSDVRDVCDKFLSQMAELVQSQLEDGSAMLVSLSAVPVDDFGPANEEVPVDDESETDPPNNQGPGEPESPAPPEEGEDEAPEEAPETEPVVEKPRRRKKK